MRKNTTQIEKIIDVNIQDSVSLRDLEEFKNRGEKLYFSPHVGNWVNRHLVLIKIGVTAIVYDLNNQHTDTIFYPGHVIQRGIPRPIGSSACLSAACPHMMEIHLDRLQGCDIPSDCLQTYGGYIRNHQELFYEITERLATDMGGDFLRLWCRYLNQDGRLVRKQEYNRRGEKYLTCKLAPPTDWETLKSEGIVHVSKKPEEGGWLPPLELALLFCCVLPYLIRNNVLTCDDAIEIHHVAGATMCGYISNCTGVIHSMLAALCSSGVIEDGVRMRFNLYPGIGAVFSAKTDGDKTATLLSEMYPIVQRLFETRREKERGIRQATHSRKKELIESLEAQKREFYHFLQEHHKPMRQLFVSQMGEERQPPYNTHHDGEPFNPSKIVVPEWVMTSTLEELKWLADVIKFKC